MTAAEIYNELTLHFWQEEEPVFPETYAGAFLEGDSLIILVTEDTEEIKEYYFNIIGEEAPVVFRIANYSYNDLLSIGENALTYFTSPIWYGVVDVRENFFTIILDKNYPNSVLEYEAFSASNRDTPVIISFSEEVAPIMETVIGDTQYSEEVLEETDNPWTLIILVTTFIILAFYSFFVVRRKSK